jgi:enoyl-[acyl-carrier protein] reductase II
LLRNKFYQEVLAAEQRGASPNELKELLGRGRAKRGMHEGELEEGELEIGQVSILLKEILPAGKIIKNIWQEFNEGLRNPVKSI